MSKPKQNMDLPAESCKQTVGSYSHFGVDNSGCNPLK